MVNVSHFNIKVKRNSSILDATSVIDSIFFSKYEYTEENIRAVLKKELLPNVCDIKVVWDNGHTNYYKVGELLLLN